MSVRARTWKHAHAHARTHSCAQAATAKRDKLQERVTQLAQGTDFKALEAASLELGVLSEELDNMEMRYLELADLAGDL